ncbi:MAG: branched-chain amino acid aminotransferase [Balneolaceae bacterium]
MSVTSTETENNPDLQTLYDQIEIRQVVESRLETVNLEDPGFGTVFSDHMAVIEYSERDHRWRTPRITPYDDFSCPPALIALHYGQSVFDGMKAFTTARNSIELFRPDMHIGRLNRSCRRLCIPELDSEVFLKTLRTLIHLDQEWVPVKRGNALYIRPLIFGTDANLGVRPSKKYTCLIMTSPVGAYYKEGINPVSLTTNPDYVRAARGGAGAAKTSGNYGSTLLPAQKAKEEGYTQILWLDAREYKYVEEVGTMNIFFKFKDKLVTPPAEGTILPGVIRDSVIQMARNWGIPVEERRISIDEVFEAHAEGTLQEIFGSGTAAVISPVGKIAHKGRTLETDMKQPGTFTKKMYDAITAIQYGEQKDPFSWMLPVVD